MNVQRTKWALGFVMMVFGLLITTQLRVQNQVYNDPGRLRADEALRQLKATEAKLKAVETERDRLAAEAAKLREANQTARDTMVPARNMTSLEMLAGTTTVEGPGVVVTLALSQEKSASKGLRDEDIWLVLHELLSAGAEGLAIDGQRVNGLTAVRGVGERILVYQTMVSSPVEIAAIGDPAVMEAALRMRGGTVEWLGRWGIKVTILKNDAVRLPPFPADHPFRFAKPVK